MLDDFLKRLPRSVKTRIRRYAPDEVALIHDLVSERRGGVMVDVGACVGEALTRFARAGWTVYAFEPDDVNRSRLVESWAAVPDVHIDARALSDVEEDSRPFYRSDVSHGISGLSAFHESHRRAGTVEVTTLGVALREYGIDHVDVLKIDTEGYDLLVLRGLDWSSTVPDVVVCEFEDAKTAPLGYTYRDLADFLVDRGYRVVISEWFPVVTYGTQHRWRGFSPYPAELMDPDGWGNLIAVRDPALAESLMRVLPTTQRRWRIGGPLERAVKS